MKFNLNNLVRLPSVDRKAVFLIGVYNGLMGISIFDNQNDTPSAPLGKILLNTANIVALEEIIKKHLLEKNQASSSIQFFSYDPDLKQSTQTGNLVVGRDENGMLYMEISTDTIKDPIRCVIKPYTFSINENALTDVQLSEYGAKGILMTLRSAIIAIMLSKDSETVAEAAKRRRAGNNTITSNNKNEDDVPF